MTYHLYMLGIYCKISHQDNALAHGIDWDGPLPQEENDADQVDVPPCDSPLTEEQYRQLQANISPLAESSNYGINLVLDSLTFIENNIIMS